MFDFKILDWCQFIIFDNVSNLLGGMIFFVDQNSFFRINWRHRSNSNDMFVLLVVEHQSSRSILSQERGRDVVCCGICWIPWLRHRWLKDFATLVEFWMCEQLSRIP